MRIVIKAMLKVFPSTFTLTLDNISPPTSTSSVTCNPEALYQRAKSKIVFDEKMSLLIFYIFKEKKEFCDLDRDLTKKNKNV